MSSSFIYLRRESVNVTLWFSLRHRRNLRGIRGVMVPPLFGLRGTVPYPHFSGRKEVSWPAANGGDLRNLNYKLQTVFGRGFARTPLGELMTLSQIQESDEEGVLPPNSPLHLLRGPRASRSLSELVPPLFRPKLRPWSKVLLSNCSRRNWTTYGKKDIAFKAHRHWSSSLH